MKSKDNKGVPRIKRVTQRYWKDFLHLFSTVPDKDKIILFVVGCQRSGTTMLIRNFSKDFNTKVYGERSPITTDDKVLRLRLNPMEKLAKEFNKQNYSIVIAKPLVESQHILSLLEFFPNSKALWIFRDFRKVAASDIKKWGPQNPISNLKPIITKEPGKWQNENIASETYELVKKYYDDSMNPYDAAAIYWYIRNYLFFQMDLHDNERVYLCSYNNLVLNSRKEMKAIYQFLGKKYPGDHINKDIFQDSLKRKIEIPVAEEIAALCEEMYARLNRTLETKSKLAKS